ncbi:MAG TPA: sulfite exporter TauE/SafE family protein [Pseudolabrys sp.]|nr:sulfite exporter TauE/SafE family protein [Pseudolabrys sp.]
MTAFVGQHLVPLVAGHATIIVTLIAIFAGALASGLAGFAFSAISGALLFHWLPPIEAVPLLLACSITTQLISIWSLWRTMRWRECATYLAGGLVGIPVGAKLLEGVNSHAFAAGFGAFLICYSAYMILRPSLSFRGGGHFAEAAAGFAGGITGGATAFPGAFPTMWCNARGMSKVEQRGIVQPFILCMQIATLIYFSKLGILASATLSAYLWCAPAVIAGTWIGLRLFKRIDDGKFRRLVLLFLIVSGATLII